MVKKLFWLAGVLFTIALVLAFLLWQKKTQLSRVDPIFQSEFFNGETAITGPQRAEWDGVDQAGLLYVVSPIKLEKISKNWLTGQVEMVWLAELNSGGRLAEKRLVLRSPDRPLVLQLEQKLSQLLTPGNYYSLSFLGLEADRPLAKDWLNRRFCRGSKQCGEYLDRYYPAWLGQIGQNFVYNLGAGEQAEFDLAELGLWVNLEDLRPVLYEQLKGQL